MVDRKPSNSYDVKVKPSRLLAQHVEGRRRGDLMNQMQANKKLRLSRRQNANAMGLPNLIVKSPSGHLRILLGRDNIGRYLGLQEPNHSEIHDSKKGHRSHSVIQVCIDQSVGHEKGHLSFMTVPRSPCDYGLSKTK
jgi:hypothetical protein